MLGKNVSPSMAARLLAPQAGESWIDFDPAVMQRDYNRLAFEFRHRLNEHPLFELDPLLALCRRLPEKQVMVRQGAVPMDAHFDSSLRVYRGDLTLEDVASDLEAKGAYIAIYNPETDPEYQTVIEGLLGEIARAVASQDPVVNWYSSYLFISTEDSVTPYHMDREMNFLFQIRGHKTARLWDPRDDSVMSPAERDRLLATHDHDSRPTYSPSLEEKARVFALRPGTGLHHPFIAPHLVRTDSGLSISLALTYRTELSDVWTDAHRVNHALRRLGLSPRSPGESDAVDTLKAGTLGALRRAKKLFER
jgi:hypothetical protein